LLSCGNDETIVVGIEEKKQPNFEHTDYLGQMAQIWQASVAQVLLPEP